MFISQRFKLAWKDTSRIQRKSD